MTKADSSAAGLTAQLEEVWSSLASLGASLDDSDWERPTPCPGWSVAAQYAHVIGTESMLLGKPNPDVDPGKPEHVRNGIGGFNEVWVAHLSASGREEVLRLFDEVTSARLVDLRSKTDDDFSAPSWTPVGEADYRRFMQIRVFDCWVHEQDVRDAVGRPGHDSGAVVEQSLDEIERALGYLVGKKAGAPEGSVVRFNLTGDAARRLDVSVRGGRASVAASENPSVTISVPAGVFARLACGRMDAESARGSAPVSALVDVSGDRELGERVLANLAFTI